MSVVGTPGQNYSSGTSVVSPPSFPYNKSAMYPDLPTSEPSGGDDKVMSPHDQTGKNMDATQVEEIIQNVIKKRPLDSGNVRKSRAAAIGETGEQLSMPSMSPPPLTSHNTTDHSQQPLTSPTSYPQHLYRHPGLSAQCPGTEPGTGPGTEPGTGQYLIQTKMPLASSPPYKPADYLPSPGGSDNPFSRHHADMQPTSFSKSNSGQSTDNISMYQGEGHLMEGKQADNLRVQTEELSVKAESRHIALLSPRDSAIPRGPDSPGPGDAAPRIIANNSMISPDSKAAPVQYGTMPSPGPFATSPGYQPVSPALNQNTEERPKGRPPGDRNFRYAPMSPDEQSNDSTMMMNASNNSSGGEESYRESEATSIDGIYYCHLCSYSGTSKFHFNAHMNSHFEHRCPNCDYSSRTEGRLNRHIKDFHSQNPPENYSGTRVIRNDNNGSNNQNMAGRPKIYRCKQCQFVSQTKVEFWEHSRSHIKDDKILQCPKCPFVTEYKHHLEYHLRNHFGSKPFKCNKCNYSCVNKSMLNSHMKSHTNVYQYRCADCTYATKYCHSLKLHLRKYNHKPATILNMDGSLDAEIGAEFPPRRGPPRGPRGPRKEKPSNNNNHMPLMLNPALMALQGFGGPRPGLMNPYWPMMAQMAPNGFPGLQPPHLIPTGNPPPIMPHSNPNPLPEASTPQTPEKSQSSSEKADTTPTIKQEPGVFKCNLCEFTSENREEFSQHILKVHAAENQDLFSMFGISSEALVEDHLRHDVTHKMMMSPQGLMTTHSANMKMNSPPNQPLHVKIEPGSNDTRPSPGSWPSDAPHHNSLDQTKQHSSQSLPDLKNMENFGQQSDDLVIDLSRPNSRESEGSSSSQRSMLGEIKPQHPMEVTQISEAQGTKRSMESESDMMAPVKKRSRKGKAYRLDKLCLRLQDEGADPVEDDYSDYSPELLEPTNSSGRSAFHAKEDKQEMSQMAAAASISHFQGISHMSIENLQQAENVHVHPLSKVIPGSSEAEKAVKEAYHRSLQIRAQKFMQNPQVQLSPGEKAANGQATPVELQHPAIDPRLIAHMRQQMTAQMEAAQRSSMYECHYCDMAFRDCVMYTMHMGYHGYQSPFKCNMCGHEASDKVDFFLHIARASHA